MMTSTPAVARRSPTGRRYLLAAAGALALIATGQAWPQDAGQGLAAADQRNARLPVPGGYHGQLCRSRRGAAPPCDDVAIRVDGQGALQVQGGWTRELKLRLGREDRVWVIHRERGRPVARYIGRFAWTSPQRLSFGESAPEGWTLDIADPVPIVDAR